MSLMQLNKKELVKAVIAAEKETRKIRNLWRKEVDKHLRTIANLQARCLTMRHQQLCKQQAMVALEHQVAGLKMSEMFMHQVHNFDIRNPDVMNRISELFGPCEIVVPSGRRHEVPLIPIHVCPMCGKITKVESGRSGERICEECRRNADWPWEGEVVWHVDEDGKMEGILRNEYRHPSGDMISTTEFQQAK